MQAGLTRLTAEVDAFAFDLDGDGVDEVLARFTSALHCGSGGCSAYILKRSGREYRRISLGTWRRIDVLASKTGGWHDLLAGAGSNNKGAGWWRYQPEKGKYEHFSNIQL